MRFHYQVDSQSLWRYPLCGVMVVLGVLAGVGAIIDGRNILLFLACVVLFGGGMLLHAYLSYKENARRPIAAVRAKVLYQTQGQEQGGKYISDVWFLTFETEQGETLEFEVSELDCKRWETGDEGLLRYRGWQFLSFGRGPLTEE